MKKLMMVILLVGIIGWTLPGCGLRPDEVTPEQSETATAQLGDLTLEITAVGNLALSLKNDLAFEVSGTVDEVLVEAGDTVEKNQVLAKLDSTSLEQVIAAAEVALRNKELDLALSDKALVSSDKALASSEIDLKTAVDNFDELIQPYAYYSITFLTDMPEAEAAINDAEQQLLNAQEGLKAEPGSEQHSAALLDIDRALENLAFAEVKLARNKGIDKFLQYTPWAKDYWKFRDANLAVQKAELAIQKAELSLSQNKDRQEKSSLALLTATDDLEIAQEALDDSVITAPLDGFVTMVNVDGGDEVKKGTLAIQLANPDKFEADVLVGEIDILQVKLGGIAWVEVDAFSELRFLARVSHISPTATIQSGVVNYRVTVEILSLEAMPPERQEIRKDIEERNSSGELPDRLRQSVEDGRISQEQAEEMMKRMESGEKPSSSSGAGGQGFTPPSGGQGRLSSPRTSGQGMPMTIPAFQLREGLTVTVMMVVSERKNVLLVPNTAITQQGNETLVRVIKDGDIESRSIVTGLSDWQFTEVISGLSESEEVVIGGTIVTTEESSQQSRPPMPFFGGGGRR